MRRIRSIFDIEKWLWKSEFCCFQPSILKRPKGRFCSSLALLILSSGACRKITVGTLSIMDPIGAAHSIQLFHKPCSEDVTLRKPRISDKNSKILLTTILLLLLSFFFATYNYSLTRGRMGGWRVPWTPQRGKNRFKAPLFQCKSFALKKYSSLKICPWDEQISRYLPLFWPVGGWFLLPVWPAKIQFKLNKKQVHQTRFFN